MYLLGRGSTVAIPAAGGGYKLMRGTNQAGAAIQAIGQFASLLAQSVGLVVGGCEQEDG
jgi:hypothetical protein